jgi:hypothetical protein
MYRKHRAKTKDRVRVRMQGAMSARRRDRAFDLANETVRTRLTNPRDNQEHFGELNHEGRCTQLRAFVR